LAAGNRDIEMGSAVTVGIRILLFSVVAMLGVAMVDSSVAQTPAPQRPSGQEVPSIGVARMRPDGTIELHLRAAGPSGIVGHGLFEYPPMHPQYADVLKHLGGLRPGEVKNVPPWPED
jgi:hypothetical protein